VGVFGGGGGRGRGFRNKGIQCVISVFRREIDEIRALLGYYAAYCGNSFAKGEDRSQEHMLILAR
jgi:hypothetical protein